MVDSNYLGNFWGNQAGFVEQVSTPPLLLVTLAQGVNAIALSWTAVPGVIRYVVYCGLSPDSLVLQADSLQSTSYTIENLTVGQRYFAQVLAVMSSGSSIASVVSSGTVIAAVYFGFAPSTTPDAVQVQALTSRAQIGFAGSYPLTQSGMTQNYACFAFPVSGGIPDDFIFNDFPVGLQQSTVTIDGIGNTVIDYNVWINPFPTASVSQAWSVD